MKRDLDDYELDLTFGQWLREQRMTLKLSVEQVSHVCGISSQRLRSLEVGYAEKGITREESEKLCSLYKKELKEFLEHACGMR